MISIILRKGIAYLGQICYNKHNEAEGPGNHSHIWGAIKRFIEESLYATTLQSTAMRSIARRGGASDQCLR